MKGSTAVSKIPIEFIMREDTKLRSNVKVEKVWADSNYNDKNGG